MSELNVRLLYKHILQAASRFPSIKRGAIVNDIKAEFRANKGLTDSAEVQQERKRAVDGLSQLEDFAGLDKKSSEWAVKLRGPSL